MSILQKNESQLRYMKRQNLKEESNVVGNYMRDIINSYGIDCVYQKLNTNAFDNFTATIDQNVILERAYGINMSPDYSCSAHMITFPEVEQDIFQLQKFGLNPNTDITFYFDQIDFACSLAEKCGQYREYKIDEIEITCEVPTCDSTIYRHIDEETGATTSGYVSADSFPFELGLAQKEYYHCDILDGKFRVELTGYQYDTPTTVVCDPYIHTDFNIEFPANSDLSHSLTHKISNSEYLQTLLYLTFTVSKVVVGKTPDGIEITKNILVGTTHGAVLFYDVHKIGKYLTIIHPEVGDIITIDYPDSENPEKYEITECFDKQLTTDGISPLLHNYIWKCKARRYVNNYDEIEETSADKHMQEKKDLNQIIEEEVVKTVSYYPDNEDSAYGGYEGKMTEYDSTKQNNQNAQTFDFIDDGTAVDIMRFNVGSRLVTTGYELLFVDFNGNAYKIAYEDKYLPVKDAIYQQDTKWIKANDQCVAFVNLEGKAYKFVEDRVATQSQMQLCLESLFEITVDSENINESGKDNFMKFKGTRTVLWATKTNLFCKLASDKQLYQIV